MNIAAYGSWAGVIVTILGFVFQSGILKQVVADLRSDVIDVKADVEDLKLDHGKRIARLEGAKSYGL